MQVDRGALWSSREQSLKLHVSRHRSRTKKYATQHITQWHNEEKAAGPSGCISLWSSTSLSSVGRQWPPASSLKCLARLLIITRSPITHPSFAVRGRAPLIFGVM